MERKIIIPPAIFVIGLWLFFSGGAAACLSGQETDSHRPDVYPEYELNIALAFDKHAIGVHEKMTVVNRTRATWERLVFCVTQAVHPSVFTLDRFALSIQKEAQTVTPSIRRSMLTVDLPRPVRPGEEAEAEIDYRLNVRKLDQYEIHPAGNLGYGAHVLQAGDCFATLTPFDPDRGFREWEYAPVGDPYIYPLAGYDVRLSAEPGVTVAAAGLAEHKGNDWRFSLERARSFAFTASRYYDVARRLVGDIPVSFYYVKGFERQAKVVLQTAAESLDLFGSLYGPYPGKELVIGQNAYSSAMEYSSFITVAHTYIRDYTPAKPQLLLSLVAHEISHQWWYDAVGSDQVMEPWLDESLAKYSEYLYFRAYRPPLAEWWEANIAVRRPDDTFIDDSIYDLADSTRTYSRVIYGLAPAFLRDLRKTIGEDEFIAFLRDYYTSGAGRFMTAADFFDVLSRHTDADITPLLRNYFRKPPNIIAEKPQGDGL
ncbi:MAG: hypothetical protein JXD23_00195 [Spirochaetales bacterium]|nr:hypothetical protein [Spirochaetales bacterium]